MWKHLAALGATLGSRCLRKSGEDKDMMKSRKGDMRKAKNAVGFFIYLKTDCTQNLDCPLTGGVFLWLTNLLLLDKHGTKIFCINLSALGF